MEEKFYYINTYGCQMNIHESEKLAGVLQKQGFIPAENNTSADVVIFNTCCIREGAEQKIYGNIGALKKQKKENPNLIIAVCGCMSQQVGKSEDIRKKFPFVDIVFGTHNLYMFEDYLKKICSKETKRHYEVWNEEREIAENMSAYRSNSFNAWVNIMYGCNNFCTYCIVPYVRGRERSRKMEDIVNEVSDLIKNKGYKIITLLGQNVNSYGKDLNDKEISFARLLDKLCKIEGDFKIKFLTSHPKDLTGDVIKAISQNNKISRAIHLPVQSGNTKILKAMNRKYTAEDYYKLIAEIKNKIPDVKLTTDIIVGFPGETESDFEDTCKLVETVRFNSIFAFMFSKRRGTAAEKFEDQIPIAIKRERVNKILALAKDISHQITSEMEGKKIDVIIESAAEGKYIGRTDCGKAIEVKSGSPLETNNFYTVIIDKVRINKLIGKVC